MFDLSKLLRLDKSKLPKRNQRINSVISTLPFDERLKVKKAKKAKRRLSNKNAKTSITPRQKQSWSAWGNIGNSNQYKDVM